MQTKNKMNTDKKANKANSLKGSKYVKYIPGIIGTAFITFLSSLPYIGIIIVLLSIIYTLGIAFLQILDIGMHKEKILFLNKKKEKRVEKKKYKLM